MRIPLTLGLCCAIGTLELVFLQVLPVHAADDDAARACVAIENDSSRLACYDRAYDRDSRSSDPVPSPSTRAAAPAAAAVATGASPRDDDVATFGREDLPNTAPPEEGPESMQAGVTAIERNDRGKHLVRLDNGQAWRQVDATDFVPVRVGDIVEIKRGAFDSYRMHRKSGGRTVTVRRVE